MSQFTDQEFDRFKLMRAAARVRRYHTVRVLHPQNVGEHTFSALALLDLIAPDATKEAWRAMLYHDVPEQITGDLPSPLLKKETILKRELEVIEQRILNDIGLPQLFDLSMTERDLIRYVDLMDCAWFCIEEIEMGNLTVTIIAQRALNMVAERKLDKINLRTEQFYNFTLMSHSLIA